MSRLSLLVLVACIALAAAKCAGKRIPKDPNGVHYSYDRTADTKQCGEIKFGPCGRPESYINIDRLTTNKQNVNGNAFQALETAGRFGEVLKLIGNRFKPEVCCPPRPPSNTDTSAEGICAQRTVRRKPGKSSGRLRPRNNGGSCSGSGSGSGSYDDNVSASNSGESSYDNGVYDDGANGDSYDNGYDNGSNSGDNNGYEVVDDVYEGDDNGYTVGYSGSGGKRRHHKHRHCGCHH